MKKNPWRSVTFSKAAVFFIPQVNVVWNGLTNFLEKSVKTTEKKGLEQRYSLQIIVFKRTYFSKNQLTTC